RWHGCRSGPRDTTGPAAARRGHVRARRPRTSSGFRSPATRAGRHPARRRSSCWYLRSRWSWSFNCRRPGAAARQGQPFNRTRLPWGGATAPPAGSSACRMRSVAHVEGADLVAVRITQVGADRLVRRGIARAGGAFVGAASGEAGLVPPGHRLIIGRGEAERVAVGNGGRFTIVRRGHDERALRTGIDQPAGFGRGHVLVAEDAHDGFVERAAFLDVVRTEEDVGKHGQGPLLRKGGSALERGTRPAAQNTTTLRMLSPACIRSKPLLISSRLSTCRSEEHTSEFQSRENLVCRLLLEKK